MQRSTRYISAQILLSTLISTIVLGSVILLMQSMRLVELILNNGTSFGEFAYMATLMLPRFIMYIMPLALFGAIIHTYSRMISENEIIALRSAGASSFHLAKAGIFSAFIICVLGYILAMVIVPLSAIEFRFLLNDNRSQWGTALLQEGKFINVRDRVTLYVRARHKEELYGLLYHNGEDVNAPYTIIAKRGAVIKTDQGLRILVVDGIRQSFVNNTLHSIDFKRSLLDFTKTTDGKALWTQPGERFLPELLWPDLGDANDRMHKTVLIAAGHNKILLPFLSFTYALISMAVVLCVGFSRRNRLFSNILAAGACVTVLLAHLGLVSLSGSHSDFIPLLYVNALCPALIALLVLCYQQPSTLFSKRKKSGLRKETEA